jgi:hypothetical protein
MPKSTHYDHFELIITIIFRLLMLVAWAQKHTKRMVKKIKAKIVN